MSIKAVVFLDIDGCVTTARTGYRTADPDCVKWLNRLIEETDAKIVVSSTWRLGKDGLKFVRAFLKQWGVIGEVIGITPDLTERRGAAVIPKDRGYEIDHFLIHHTEHIERFAIIDDDTDMAHLGRFLVKTSTDIGFQEADYVAAKMLLTNGRRFAEL